MSDFTIENGKIVGLQAGSQFEYGERYVKCRNCGISRPAKELKPYDNLPFCKDGCKTIRDNS